MKTTTETIAEVTEGGASRTLRIWLIGAAAVLVMAIPLAGCGGDGSGDGTTATTSSAPEPTESIDDFANRFAAAGSAATEGDCDVVDEFNRDAGFTIPCEPGGAAGYTDVKIADTEAFGPAGLVDYTSAEAPDGATAIAAVSEGGQYQLIQSLIPASLGLSATQVGTEPEGQDLRDGAVADFVTATRDEDCDAYYEVALTTMSKARECKIQFDPKSLIQPQLAAAADATPEPLGGTEAFGLHGLDTGENYRVLLTVRQYGPDDDPGEVPYLVVSYRSR